MCQTPLIWLLVWVAVLGGAAAGCDKGDGSASSGGAAGEGQQIPTIEPARFLEGHTDGVHGVAFSPDGKRIATAGHDGSARIWDVASAKELRRLEGHTGPVHAVAFSDDGTRVATTGEDGVVMVWDADNGDLLSMLEGHRRGAVLDVAFLPSGILASVGQDRSLRRWDPDQERQIGAVMADAMQVMCVNISADGTRLATSGASGFIVVWDADTGRPIWRERAPQGSPDEEELIARQKRQAEPAATAPAPADDAPDPDAEGGDDDAAPVAAPGQGRPVIRLAFSPDGARLYSQISFGLVHEWDARTGKYVRHFEPYVPAIAMDLSGDGKHLLVVATTGLQVWDAAAMKVVANLGATPLSRDDGVHRAAVSPDGRTAAIALGGKWNNNGTWRRAIDTRVPLWDLSSLPK